MADNGRFSNETISELRGWILLAATLAMLCVPMIRAIERNSTAIESLDRTMADGRMATARELAEVKQAIELVRRLEPRVSAMEARDENMDRRLSRMEDNN